MLVIVSAVSESTHRESLGYLKSIKFTTLSLFSIIKWIGYRQFVLESERDIATWENMVVSAESFK